MHWNSIPAGTMAAMCSAPEAKITRTDPPAWVSDEVLPRDRDNPTLALTG